MCYFQSSQNDPSYPEWQKTSDREVKQMYELITIKLPALEKQMEVEWENVPKQDIMDINTNKFDYQQIYGKIDRLEKEIYDLQTEIMVWVVKNRNILWT